MFDCSHTRYDIQAKNTPDIRSLPNRFLVRIKRHRLAWLLMKELIQYWGKWKVVLSRPCMYGVFSGPLGGFAPRENLCVGCLRCTTEHPEIVQIYHNEKRLELGDSFFSPENFENVCYEARTGRVPVRGAGYRGPFGGTGWDGMWTDMSEIVRPTRDGIHGREYISTSVDIGAKPPYVPLDQHGNPLAHEPRILSIPLPVIFDAPAASVLSSPELIEALAVAAAATGTLAIIPANALHKLKLRSRNIVPLISSEDPEAIRSLHSEPLMVEVAGPDQQLLAKAREHFPKSVICTRLDYLDAVEIVRLVSSGQHVLHLVANYHGQGRDGRFVLDAIRDTHNALVKAGCREQATVLGCGGIIAAEHVPKAIICGLDAVAIDSALLAALQATFVGECMERESACFELPKEFHAKWAARRIVNLMASWHDQLLEVLGAMGLREVRRLRGEVGRAMFQKDLEREAFSGIEGYVG